MHKVSTKHAWINCQVSSQGQQHPSTPKPPPAEVVGVVVEEQAQRHHHTAPPSRDNGDEEAQEETTAEARAQSKVWQPKKKMAMARLPQATIQSVMISVPTLIYNWLKGLPIKFHNICHKSHESIIADQTASNQKTKRNKIWSHKTGQDSWASSSFSSSSSSSSSMVTTGGCTVLGTGCKRLYSQCKNPHCHTPATIETLTSILTDILWPSLHQQATQKLQPLPGKVRQEAETRTRSSHTLQCKSDRGCPNPIHPWKGRPVTFVTVSVSEWENLIWFQWSFQWIATSHDSWHWH